VAKSQRLKAVQGLLAVLIKLQNVVYNRWHIKLYPPPVLHLSQYYVLPFFISKNHFLNRIDAVLFGTNHHKSN